MSVTRAYSIGTTISKKKKRNAVRASRTLPCRHVLCLGACPCHTFVDLPVSQTVAYLSSILGVLYVMSFVFHLFSPFPFFFLAFVLCLVLWWMWFWKQERAEIVFIQVFALFCHCHIASSRLAHFPVIDSVFLLFLNTRFSQPSFIYITWFFFFYRNTCFLNFNWNGSLSLSFSFACLFER